ncbi:PREDICTED: ecto-ADP-ribosyltransferase 3 [Hipposideros armiger]|uniref:NAD(P)(+)--arginine ADP-ribosyltransferase n=1 Tax=Hipposideros armiger TaxID=186990 RepID=A0A8B7PTI2_HIPAR|nr:PREDICTED: ecto-ADP-ribosyltransferase 3 [Hipposideros armiger]
MKTGHFEMITMLLSAMILMDVFQVKAEMLDMADNAFDDEYQKCTDRMEIKYVPQLLKEEKTSYQPLEDVWENAKAKWEARKTHIFLPVSFKDNHGIALMAYISEAQEQTSFYHLFNEAVKMAGQSRKDYIYGFQFKAFHFYLTKALQLLRRPCEDSYKNVVYRTSPGASFTFGGLNQARFGHFTLAYSAKPQVANDQHILLTIHTCFGVAIERLKTANCVENMEYFQPISSPGDKSQKLEEPEKKSQESTVLPDMKSHEPIQIPATKVFKAPGPGPAPVPVPGPKTHPSASSGKMLLPPFGTVIILISASAICLFVAL